MGKSACLRWCGPVLFVGVAAILSGCDGHLAAPDRPFAGPEAASSSGCDLDPEDCEAIEDAIFWLQGHPDDACRDLAEDAQWRFNSDVGGYVPGDPDIDEDAYTKMTDSSGEWEPVDEYVYVNAPVSGPFAPSVEDLADWLIAHEEQHHRGWDPYHTTPGISCPAGGSES